MFWSTVGSVAGWGEIGVTDPGVLSPEPCWDLVGVSVSYVRYPILDSSQPEGLSFVACLDRSGSSDALGEFAIGCDRAESGFVVCDGVGIALL